MTITAEHHDYDPADKPRLTKGATVRCLTDDGFVHVGLVGTVFGYTNSYMRNGTVLVQWRNGTSCVLPVGQVEVIRGKDSADE